MKRVLAIVCLVTSGTAHADDKATAETYFRAGAKAYAAQNFQAAATDFDEAYKAMPLAEIAFSGAQAYRRLYRVEPKVEYVKRAIELYRAYLAKVKSGGRIGDAADNLGEMERELDKLKASGAQMNVRADQTEHTRLGISVTIADQHVDTSALREVGDVTGEATKGLKATLDGQPIEPFALVDVDAREHVLAVSADGYLPAEKKATAVAGQSQLIEVELKPRSAKVVVTTEDDARISIDGRTVASGPRAPLELAAGKHLLVVVHRGREPFGRELVVTRGQELAIAAPLVQTARRRAVPWVWGGAGVLALAATTTGILALVHDGRASDLRSAIAMGGRPPSDADAYDTEVRSRDRYNTATLMFGGTAIVAGAVGAFLFFSDSGSSEGLHLTPVAGAGTGGAVLSGRF